MSQRVLAALVAIAATLLLVCAPGETVAADASKAPNVDVAKRGSSPRTESVAQATLADQVARHADRNKDVLAMIAAARLMSQVGPRTVKIEVRSEGKPKAADSKTAGGLTRDTTLNGLLARARQYAGGRNDLNGLVDEVSRSAAKARQDGAARIAARIGDGVTDVYTVSFRADEPVMIAINGEGVSDLDLSAEDDNGNRVCSSTGAGDDESCRWTPRRDGAFRIRVRNLGSVFNEYRLWMN